MRVDETNALRIEGAGLDHVPNFRELRHFHFEQSVQFFEPLTPFAEGTESNLSRHKRVHHDLSSSKKLLHLKIATAKIVNPNRGVGQNHKSSALTTLDPMALETLKL